MTTFVQWVILSQPLVFWGGPVGDCVDWTDCNAACGCCAGLHCDHKVRHPHPHHPRSACLQDTLPTCISHTISSLRSDLDVALYSLHWDLEYCRRSPEVVASKRWILAHYLVRCVGRPCTAMQSNFYHDCGWSRALPAATTLKRGVSAFFPSTYFETL
jgi:hypothetical protein